MAQGHPQNHPHSLHRFVEYLKSCFSNFKPSRSSLITYFNQILFKAIIKFN